MHRRPYRDPWVILSLCVMAAGALCVVAAAALSMLHPGVPR